MLNPQRRRPVQTIEDVAEVEQSLVFVERPPLPDGETLDFGVTLRVPIPWSLAVDGVVHTDRSRRREPSPSSDGR